MTITAHTDHLLFAARVEHAELVQAVGRRRLSRVFRRSRSPVPVVRAEREVALAA